MTSRLPTLGIVAASSFMPDPAVIDRAAAWFAARGWRVQAGETCFLKDQRFAGPDEVRAAELQRFCTDRTLDVVIAARGGYGLTRILEHLDFAAIVRAGRTIVGYSDFTAFNLALLAHGGRTSFQGPSAVDFGAVEVDPYMAEHFMAAVGGVRHQVEFAADGPACNVKGTLWGGNLALLCALVGTPFLPRVRGGILFLEDVNEAAYRVERMLLQLQQCGILARQRAILLGDFSPMPTLANDNGYDRAAVVATLRERLDVPVIDGLPFGHVARKLTLPVGARAQLVVDNSRAQLSWSRAAS